MSWLLTACHHLDGEGTCWAADCLAPGCLWTVTTGTPDTADEAAAEHAIRVHPHEHEQEDE